MSLTPSAMLALGTIAPNFLLTDTVSGKILSLTSLKSEKATVIMFICNHCPYVLHIIDKVVERAQIYQDKGVAFIAISSNDVDSFPQDDLDKMHDFAVAHHFTFPYLYDESQEVAKSYQATCTPDFFVFNDKLSLVYRGRFDEAAPGNKVAVTGNELSTALDHLLANEPIATDQKPSIGCNIKWK